MAQLTDEAYTSIKGTTDSECCFGLLLTNLSKDGMAPKGASPFEQKEPFGHDRLYHAVKRTIRQLEHILKISGVAATHEAPSRMNFTLTDGETVVCSRFCDQYPRVAPPSLYFAYGDATQMQQELCDDENNGNDDQHSSDDGSTDENGDNEYDAVEQDLSFQQSLPGKLLKEVDPATSAFIVASDPLTKASSEISWHRIAANSILCYTSGSIPRLYKLNVGGAKRPEDYAFFLVDF